MPTIIKERTFVYAIGSEEGPVKVGITTNLGSRLRSLQNGSATRLDLIWVYTFWDREAAISHERSFHDVCAEHRLEGEWFDITAAIAAEVLENGIIHEYDGSIDWFSSGGTLEKWCEVVHPDLFEKAKGNRKELIELLAKRHVR
jgi:predicted GIY-YIG superfamily endonuclease